jgi:hypothetical protein
MTWAKSFMHWRDENYLYVSVPFTWELPNARAFCLSHPTDRIIVGGPAVSLMPDYVVKWAQPHVGPTKQFKTPPLLRADAQATRTTLGCPKSCSFCGVNTIEGEYRELDEWEPRPIVCDSNLMAASDAHFERVIDRLKILGDVQIDFNQGLDAALMTRRRAARLAELDFRPRLAWDRAQDEKAVFKAIEIMENAGIRCRSGSTRNTAGANCCVYCLVGFDETFEEAHYRLSSLREHRIGAVAMRYQPLDALEKNSYWPKQWDPQLLLDFVRYWNRQKYFGGLTFQEFRAGESTQDRLFDLAGR